MRDTVPFLTQLWVNVTKYYTYFFACKIEPAKCDGGIKVYRVTVIAATVKKSNENYYTTRRMPPM